MLDTTNLKPPPILETIKKASSEIGFLLSSDMLTGSFLRTLAATKPAGRLLELGTGTGQGTAWLLDGMDAQSRLISVDRDEEHSTIARRFLDQDPRVTFLLQDGATFIEEARQSGERFDLIFADMQPGKFTLLAETLALLAKGGIYIVDDLLMYPALGTAHIQQVFELIATLEGRKDLHVTKLNWSTGLLMAVKKG